VHRARQVPFSMEDLPLLLSLGLAQSILQCFGTISVVASTVTVAISISSSFRASDWESLAL
jgi:hypothetical protein